MHIYIADIKNLIQTLYLYKVLHEEVTVPHVSER